MRLSNLLRAWGAILLGNKPVLSVEITKECPLACPGCYAYQPHHVSGAPLVSLNDFRGDNLVGAFRDLIERHRPLGVYIVGGEPLVRFRELDAILADLNRRGVQAEVVTSAVRPIPSHWSRWKGLTLTVSVDGLQPEHDARRKPATYERILQHIRGHRIVVHCTVTSQMVRSDGHLEKFVRFWHGRSEVKGIRVSLFTPQVGEDCEEMLTSDDREKVVREMGRLHSDFPKLLAGPRLLRAYLKPPRSPSDCTFARVTRCVSADLKTAVTPCQLGGAPDCSKCGCVASMGLEALSRHRLPLGPRVGTLLRLSEKIGGTIRSLRNGSEL